MRKSGLFRHNGCRELGKFADDEIRTPFVDCLPQSRKRRTRSEVGEDLLHEPNHEFLGRKSLPRRGHGLNIVVSRRGKRRMRKFKTFQRWACSIRRGDAYRVTPTLGLQSVWQEGAKVTQALC